MQISLLLLSTMPVKSLSPFASSFGLVASQSVAT